MWTQYGLSWSRCMLRYHVRSAKDKSILEAAYHANPKPDKAARLEIVNRVSLNEKEVQVSTATLYKAISLRGPIAKTLPRSGSRTEGRTTAASRVPCLRRKSPRSDMAACRFFPPILLLLTTPRPTPALPTDRRIKGIHTRSIVQARRHAQTRVSSTSRSTARMDRSMIERAWIGPSVRQTCRQRARLRMRTQQTSVSSCRGHSPARLGICRTGGTPEAHFRVPLLSGAGPAMNQSSK